MSFVSLAITSPVYNNNNNPATSANSTCLRAYTIFAIGLELSLLLNQLKPLQYHSQVFILQFNRLAHFDFLLGAQKKILISQRLCLKVLTVKSLDKIGYRDDFTVNILRACHCVSLH